MRFGTLEKKRTTPQRGGAQKKKKESGNRKKEDLKHSAFRKHSKYPDQGGSRGLERRLRVTNRVRVRGKDSKFKNWGKLLLRRWQKVAERGRRARSCLGGGPKGQGRKGSAAQSLSCLGKRERKKGKKKFILKKDRGGNAVPDRSRKGKHTTTSRGGEKKTSR